MFSAWRSPHIEAPISASGEVSAGSIAKLEKSSSVSISTVFGANCSRASGSRDGALPQPANLLRRTVKPAAVRAGVPWASQNTLRHTCASMLFRAGWNAKQVQTMLGHHSPAFTLATYVHLIPEDLPEPVFRSDLLGDQAASREPTLRPRRVSRRK